LGTHLHVRLRAWKLFRRVPALVMSNSYELRADFHGGNTGSNPVGDANNLNDLLVFRILTVRRGHAVVTIETFPPASVPVGGFGFPLFCWPEG
jgi:hypothetical protein